MKKKETREGKEGEEKEREGGKTEEVSGKDEERKRGRRREREDGRKRERDRESLLIVQASFTCVYLFQRNDFFWINVVAIFK